MLRKSRVGTIPDLTRLSAGVSRPGIDPRINVSRAEALKDSTIDKEHGHYVDVQLLPSGLELTCRVPQEYAGKDFGNHEGIIHEGDELYIAIPEGDPTLGPIVIARVWSEQYPPPELVEKNPKDIVRVFEKDISFRALLQGDKSEAHIEFKDKQKLTIKIGDFEVIIDNSSSPTTAHFKTDDGDVFKLTKDGLELGVEPDDFVALSTPTNDDLAELHDKLDALVTKFNAHKHQVSGIATAGGPTSQTQTAPVNSAAPDNAPADAPAAMDDVASEFTKSK